MFNRCLIIIALAQTALSATAPTDLLVGHYEIHVDYTVAPGNPNAGWKFSVSYDQDHDFSTSAGVVRLDPETTVVIASPKTATTVPSPAGVFSRFGPSGTPIWVFPQNQLTGAPFLGVRTTMAAGLFQARVGTNYTPSGQGSISLRLVSVEGTGAARGGRFATWKSESFGTTVFAFDTTDGISAADEIPTIPVSSHTHYNWGLTKPGTYRVTFEAQGKLMPSQGNVITSARSSFNFVVPFSSRIRQSAGLRIVASPGARPRMVLADSSIGVAYAPNQAMIETSSATASWLGAIWETGVTLSSAVGDFPDGVGISPADASTGLSAAEWSDLCWTLTEIRGPGGMALLQSGSVVADGPGDSISLTPGSARNLVAAFKETGIYRVTGIISGLRNGIPVTSESSTIVFGAGVTADYDYAAWQASFTKAANLPAGALANPTADFDQDGIQNSVEFAFFWQGLDPTMPDGHLMPQPFPTPDGFASLNFLRDSFKDPLDESKWQIRPATSIDLVNWSVRSSRVPGFPLGIFETGAGLGNAKGRIMQQQLRVLPAVQARSFFRFYITPPSP